MPGTSMYPPPGTSSWTPDSRQPPPGKSPDPTIQIFISREDGSLVPVVPIDQLPQDVRLVGVPQRLTPAQTRGMVNAGCYPTTVQLFSLASTHTAKQSDLQHHYPSPVPAIPTRPRAFSPAEQRARAVGHNELSQRGSTLNSHPKPAASTSTASKEAKPPTQPKSYFNERPLPPSGVEPDPKKKEFCSHWIQHGSCSFAQQGCRYKHEMPNMAILREKFGYQKVPAWWRREQNRKRAEARTRHRSSSEWEEIERQSPKKAVARSRDPPVRFSVGRPSPGKVTTPKPVRGPSTMNDTPMQQQQQQQQPLSPLGGVRLAKPLDERPAPEASSVFSQHVQPSKNPLPEFDLIDFDDEIGSSLDVSDASSSALESKSISNGR